MPHKPMLSPIDLNHTYLIRNRVGRESEKIQLITILIILKLIFKITNLFLASIWL